MLFGESQGAAGDVALMATLLPLSASDEGVVPSETQMPTLFSITDAPLSETVAATPGWLTCPTGPTEMPRLLPPANPEMLDATSAICGVPAMAWMPAPKPELAGSSR